MGLKVTDRERKLSLFFNLFKKLHEVKDMCNGVNRYVSGLKHFYQGILVI